MNARRSVVLLSCILLAFTNSGFAARMRLQAGTAIHVRLKADLVAYQVGEGSRVDFEVARPVVVGGYVLVPPGAVVWGAVQSVKKGKEIKFDLEGLRLPDLTEVKLRSVRERTKKATRDAIKIETHYSGGVGAPHGSEFTAWIDEDVMVEATPATAQAQPAAAPAVSRPAVAAPAPAPAVVTTPAAVAPVAAAPTPAPAQQPSAPAAPAVASGERITVECFSDPTGADIVIDGEYYGSTPSILKVPVGNHRLEFQLAEYKTFSRVLNLEPASSLVTIRQTLEKRE